MCLFPDTMHISTYVLSVSINKYIDVQIKYILWLTL